MHRSIIAVLAGLCILAATAMPASAHQRMTFDFAVRIADGYWAKRGVDVPCHPLARLLSYDETRDWLTGGSPLEGGAPEMLATPERCLIEITPWAESWRTDLDPELRADYCWDIAHEVGHLAGLEHPDYAGNTSEQAAWLAKTVMNSDGAPYPFGCEHPRQWLVRHGIGRAPQWVRRSPRRVERLWLGGHVQQARVARARWLSGR